MIIDREVEKEEIKHDRVETDDVDTVFTRARTDTPAYTRVEDPVDNRRNGNDLHPPNERWGNGR